MEPLITVFTPTFNRAYTLHLCYESLLRQTSKDFIWLIIDDGSTDGTAGLVEGWQREADFPIAYIYQENQGMHGAHNTAYEHIRTELNVCIDSDDYMTDHAIEAILSFWKRHGSERYAGIAALDASPDGAVIGTRLPAGLQSATQSELYARHGVKGDKKLIYRSALTSGCPPYPVFEGEKYCPLSYKYILIDQQQPLLLMNEVVCIVEYRTDGSSMNILKQYLRNPRGFSFFRKTAMQYAVTYKDRFREAVHYVSSNLILRNRRFLSESPRRWTTLLAVPLGVALYVYLNRTKRSTVMKNG
ncbi:glycosyltransferase family 2 protein [Paenibacillus sp. 1011MAR3C5]|uniref:glycosyltransferase family 2 protein n=1 Tax=Paenibacillus sp. 1011MAR3C5 TaxID=1675787 RepID=UPI000E6CB23B|nr:glycosyltransferase family 2 protein [Paenibacillus sp. 1011MAR3C5]RJE91159.1 glycosyltransferase family 2 protein [Paenibacillus sp. 1011MAR3C5]